MSGSIEWLPLESNPDVITNFMHTMGVEKDVKCVDVLGFDEELLAILPQPCYALLLCFPNFTKVDEIMGPVYDKLAAEGVKVPENVFFMKQKIHNACGTFALLHSLANNRNRIDLGSGALKQWLEKALPLDLDARSDSLANDQVMASAHENCARGGDTDAEPGNVEHHFICFVIVDGTLYEIDSRAPFPRECGSTAEENLLRDAGRVCQDLMSKLKDVSFSALAIVRDA